LLVSSFYDIIERLKPLLPHPTKLIEKAATLEQRIKDIHTHLIQRISSSFRSIVGKTESKMEVIVSFLALLELVKQRTVTVQQPQLFEDISIDKI
jgi:segregation and condensation protein A